MITPADEAVLAQLVGATTMVRARDYARQGAVVHLHRSGTEVAGAVQGTVPAPYQVSVTLVRAPSGRLSDIRSSCTCPVGVDCKHAVALLLAAATPGAGGGAHAPRKAAPREWERSLQGLLGAASEIGGLQNQGWTEPGDPETGTVGLQFEVLAVRPASRRSARAPYGPASPPGGPGDATPSDSASPGIRLRPIVRSTGGKWSRTGISWTSLQYHALQPRRLPEGTAERVQLLQELLALHRLAHVRTSYGYTDEPVWLDAIGSRRLWDLLHQAEDAGLPFVLQAGRASLPVVLHRAPAEPVIDATRTTGGITLAPHLQADGQRLQTAELVLVGDPAHGIAWWDTDSPGAPAGTPTTLHLAQLARPLPVPWRQVVRAEPVVVPTADEERYFRQVHPLLQRKVPVTSSDGSVDLPDAAPVALVLSVHHRPGPGVELAWGRGVPGEAWTDDLWPASTEPGGPAGAGSGRLATGANRTTARDHGPEAQVEAAIEAATGIVRHIPGLVVPTHWGERLVPRASLREIDAVRFVAELLPALAEVPALHVEQQGTAPGYRAALEAPVVSLGGSRSADGDWFDLAVSVRVGDEPVPFGHLFTALAEGRTHLVLPSGTYFPLDSDELRQLAARIAEARAMADGSGDAIRLSRWQVSLWEDLRALAVPDAEARRWEASVRSLADATTAASHPPPDGLVATLRPYQQVGFDWLATRYEHRLGGILADDMGLGKTVQALAVVCHARQHHRGGAPFLVVAPTSVVGNWAAECHRFAPGLRVATVTETASRRQRALADVAAGADLVVTSYTLERLEHVAYESLEWAGVFLDEAQFAKNPASQTYRRARALQAPFKVAMTGTPMENNLMELWALLSITAPGLFPRPDAFTEMYRVPIERNGDPERLAQLRRRMRPVVLRRTKEQVAPELPDKQQQVLALDLDPRHRRLYQSYLHRERQKVLGLLDDVRRNRIAILRSLTLLRQASLDVSLVDPAHAGTPSTKLDALVPMLQEIAADGHRALVFSQFTRFLGLARQRLRTAGIDHCYLDGRTRRRDEVVADFRSGRVPVFLISLKAGGFGLNLTEADYCILLDPWWNPATEAQAVDRVHRIGQTRKVMVYRLVARDTIEEKVMALKERKAALFASVVDAGGFEAAGLTAEDLRDLVG